MEILLVKQMSKFKLLIYNEKLLKKNTSKQNDRIY